MGGSVAVHVAAKKALPSLAGLVVVDVVEVCFSVMLVFFLDHNKLRISFLKQFSAFLQPFLDLGNCHGFIDSYAKNLIQQDATFS